MKLIAQMPIKHGSKDGIVEFAEGETFEVDKKAGEALLASGAAAAPTAKGGKTAAEKDEERRLSEEAAIAEANAKAERERLAAEGKGGLL